MKDRNTSKNIPLIVTQTTFVLAWSSGWIAAEIAVPFAGTPLILTLRFWGATVVMALVVAFRGYPPANVVPGGSLRRISPGVAVIALVGILSQTIWLVAVLESQRHGVSPGVNALINAMQPLVTALIAPLLLAEQRARGMVPGILLAILGLGMVVSTEITVTGTPWWAYTIPFVSVASMTGAVLLKRSNIGTMPDGLDWSGILLIQFLASAIVMTLLLSLGIGTAGDAVQWTLPFFAVLLWMILVPTIASYALLWRLVDHGSATGASKLFLASPPATLIMSVVIFDTSISWIEILGIAIVLIGLSVTQGEHRQRGTRTTSAHPGFLRYCANDERHKFDYGNSTYSGHQRRRHQLTGAARRG